MVCDWELRELEHERVDATVALQGGFLLTCRKLDQTIVVLYSTETRWGFAYIPALWLEQDQVKCSSATTPLMCFIILRPLILRTSQ